MEIFCSKCDWPELLESLEQSVEPEQDFVLGRLPPTSPAPGCRCPCFSSSSTPKGTEQLCTALGDGLEFMLPEVL